jgi:hypothetical protein
MKLGKARHVVVKAQLGHSYGDDEAAARSENKGFSNGYHSEQ